MKEEELRDKCLEALTDHFDTSMEDFKEEGQGYGPIDSPIERMLYAALWVTRAKANQGTSDVDPIWHRSKYGSKTEGLTPVGHVIYGVDIIPQRKIGKYRVDFLVERSFDISITGESPSTVNQSNSVVVECDGHDWHERSEEDRRCEKQRDRYIISKGYKIFRFTGKEITDDPFEVASEIFRYLDVG
jgi:very-short-patch-repair endonuclease